MSISDEYTHSFYLAIFKKVASLNRTVTNNLRHSLKFYLEQLAPQTSPSLV